MAWLLKVLQNEVTQMSKYLAHRSADGREQTVLEHLEGTSRLCAGFARRFRAEEQGRLAGLAHDIGKYSDAFQRRLQGGPPVDHSTAGAVECMRLRQPYAAFAVAGHHGGLPDAGVQGDLSMSGTFFSRMERAVRGALDDCSAWQDELSLPDIPVQDTGDIMTEGMFFTRMLFSCLVDADYTDTGEFMDGAPDDPRRAPSTEQLWGSLKEYVAKWFPPKGKLNTERCAILERCILEGERREPGLFTLTVPTGGGKTVASLAFALAQAKARGMSRVVYVIPYTSIIEQTAKTFREILGDGCVLEHHSNVLYDIEGEASPASQRMASATETWDMPVIVTTAVQFFESLFSCKPSQCRKLHNLAGSVVIFDEAQMMPLPYLRPCVWAISQLVRRYGVSAVLCTATQPALGPLFREFAPKLSMTELCPIQAASREVFKRVTFRRAGTLCYDEIAAQLRERQQALCIVNSRKSAQEIFSRLSGEDSFHLSTLMYPAHRKAQLDEIRSRLRAGLPCRVVSTSLIEAGVDVSFPAVYREEAGLDSILQAAGRCNREGKSAAADSIVTIFRGEGAPPRLFAAAIGAGRLVMSRWDDFDSPEAIHAYFSALLDLRGTDALDAKEILPLMQKKLFPFRTVWERFHLIDETTETVYIPLGKGGELADRLRRGERNRELFRQLGLYGVSVYHDHFCRLEQSGCLERLEDGPAILADLSLYSANTGLSLEADSGRAEFV